MGHEIPYALEPKRLVWLIGVLFAVVIMFQYFEFPYGDVGSSLFSANDPRIPEMLGKVDSFNGSNRTTPADVLHRVGPGNDFEDTGEFTDEDEVAGERADAVFSVPVPAPAPTRAHTVPLDSTTSTPDKAATNSPDNLKEPQRNLVPSVNKVPRAEESRERPIGEVVTISEMREMLARNRASSRSMKPRWASKADRELLDAKSQIENAAPVDDNDRTLYSPLYRNVSMFKRSYKLMEKTLKVYIYKEGERPIFHEPQAVLKGIYASEGWFMKHMKSSTRFVTKKPERAHLFYLPFSSRTLEEKLYVPGSHSHDPLVRYLKDYLDLIVGRYGFWNRTGGSDHFLVACHDWAAAETRKYMNDCIRALCNSDVRREGFVLGKDAALPETFVRSAKNPSPSGGGGGPPPSRRPFLAFFAGQMHGDVRPALLRHWRDKDPDMKIFGRLPKSKNNRNYINYMRSAKYCVCAKGYEVNSPRVVEAILHGCVPVVISDNFVPPFFEVLDWETLAVFVAERDIPRLKEILVSIPEKRYLEMRRRVERVQQHFVWHVKPVKYDIFHMILHSIWYNRVFRVNPR